jgi:ABC-type dipeptide/oligopeptide/nickel transport system permease component
LQGVILLTTFVFVFASLLVDVLYLAIDPRVRIR